MFKKSSRWWELNSWPLPYQGSALPLSYIGMKSGRRNSNPRPLAWKANALPTELLPLIIFNQHPSFFRYCRENYPGHCKSGESRIRTYEVIRQQIYSLPQLATLVSPRLYRACPVRHTSSLYNEPMKGFEPLTCRLQISCSGQLSYIGIWKNDRFLRIYPQKSVCKCRDFNFKSQNYRKFFWCEGITPRASYPSVWQSVA